MSVLLHFSHNSALLYHYRFRCVRAGADAETIPRLQVMCNLKKKKLKSSYSSLMKNNEEKKTDLCSSHWLVFERRQKGGLA